MEGHIFGILRYFKIVSNCTRLTACEITHNNFEISLVLLPRRSASRDSTNQNASFVE